MSNSRTGLNEDLWAMWFLYTVGAMGGVGEGMRRMSLFEAAAHVEDRWRVSLLRTVTHVRCTGMAREACLCLTRAGRGSRAVWYV